MIDWKRKLSSRKFWVALAGFVTGLIAYIKNPGDPTGLIMSIGTLVAYILGEGLADAASARSDIYVDTTDDQEEGVNDGE